MLGRALRAFVALTMVFAQTASAGVGGAWLGGGRNALLFGYAQPVPAGGCFPSSGVILDINPADTSTLFQTITGTTAVTADGDVVGTAKDANGNGFDLTAPGNDTTRPLYKTSGGLSWLKFDGSNDVLRRSANLGLYSGGAMTIVMAFQEETTQQASYISEGKSTDANPFYDIMRHAAASPTDLFINSRNDNGTFELNGVHYYTNGVTLSTDEVVIVTDTGSTITGYLDGTAGTGQNYTRGTHSNADRFSLGARTRTTTDSYAAIRVYRLVAYNRVLSSGEIATATTCAKATQGR